MFDAEEAQHMLYRIGNAPIRDYPFPHFVADGVFSDDFYRDIIRSFPESKAFTLIGETGRLVRGDDPHRSILEFKGSNTGDLPPEYHSFWSPFLEWLQSDPLTLFLLNKFDPLLRMRFGARLADAVFGADLQIVNDSRHYQLHPHTDDPQKVVVLLFYLPADETNENLGTSFYVPNDPSVRCEGTRQHDSSDFTRVVTFPYRPNSVVGFFKSGRSFHGVEPIEEISGSRHLIQLSIKHGFPGTSELMPVPLD